jgi:hypothetical protein
MHTVGNIGSANQLPLTWWNRTELFGQSQLPRIIWYLQYASSFPPSLNQSACVRDPERKFLSASIGLPLVESDRSSSEFVGARFS